MDRYKQRLIVLLAVAVLLVQPLMAGVAFAGCLFHIDSESVTFNHDDDGLHAHSHERSQPDQSVVVDGCERADVMADLGFHAFAGMVQAARGRAADVVLVQFAEIVVPSHLRPPISIA